MKYLALGFCLVFFSGCIEHYNQLCIDSSLKDIPGLAGKKTVTLFDPGSSESIKAQFEIKRFAKGEYKIEEVEFRACQFATRTITEFKLSNGNFAAKELLLGPGGQYSESALVIGKSDLKKLGIPFKMEERAPSQEMIPKVLLKNPKIKAYADRLNQESPHSVLVVHTRHRAEDKRFVENLRPFYIGFSYQ